MNRGRIDAGPVEVREATPTERDRIAAVQVMAFGSDPIMRWLYPSPDEYLRHYPAFVSAFGGVAFDHATAYVAEDFGGAALWLPPGEALDGAQVVSVFRETVGQPALDEVLELLEQMDRYHIDEAHWYLPMIGVDPAHQGRGIGSSLLRHALARCDEDGLPAYLESSNPANVPLYERHGFRVVATLQVGSSPELFPMLRDARGASR